MFQVLTGDRDYWLNKARENIEAHRRCVASNRDFFNRKYSNQYWLIRAARCRRIAAGLEPVINNFLVANIDTGEAAQGALYAKGV